MRKISIIGKLKRNAKCFVERLDEYIKKQEQNEDDYLELVAKKDYSVDFNIGPYRVIVETNIYAYKINKAVFKVSFIDTFTGEKGNPVRDLYSSCGVEGDITFAARKTINSTDNFPNATPEELDVTILGKINAEDLAEKYIFQIEKYISEELSKDFNELYALK